MPCPKCDAAAASAILTTTVNVRPKTWSFVARKKIKRAGSPAVLSERSVKLQMHFFISQRVLKDFFSTGSPLILSRLIKHK
jgi:hypothetical protein